MRNDVPSLVIRTRGVRNDTDHPPAHGDARRFADRVEEVYLLAGKAAAETLALIIELSRDE
jgi:hypothetical protein